MGTVTLDRNSIVTYTGKVINPLAPDPEQISIVDIAHALSNICRFTGHTSEFYSVAQHSCLMVDMVPEPDRLWALMHDTPEAYLADLAKPIKRSLGGLAEAYNEAEARLMDAIAVRFDLSPMSYERGRLGLPRSVKEADLSILKGEVIAFMPQILADDLNPTEEDFEVWANIGDPWTPKNAKTNFLIRFAELTDNDFQID